MYLPAAFQQIDRGLLTACMERHSFGVLTSAGPHGPEATHLPFLYVPEAGPYGTLISHMAKSNPHWRYADGETVLAIFSGPDAYISPSWYASENVVPTWNYVAVHATGKFEPVFDPDEILDIVQRTVVRYEASRATPWTFDPSTDFAQRLAQMVVGFRIELTRLDGKWKLSQNHSPERRRRVIHGLELEADPQARELARLMALAEECAEGV